MTDVGRKLGRFRVLGEVARGGMGTILRAWDDELRRNLAIKVLSDDTVPQPDVSTTPLLARFREEAQVTGQLDHPGVVPIHELGEDENGNPFFAMRLVRGQTFGEIIDYVHVGQGGWTQTRALGVLLKVCEAVAFAHEKGVVHRDLKPANVMVGRFGETYVMDWGLAKVMDREPEETQRVEDVALSSVSLVHTDRKEQSDSASMYGDVVGTPSFMPPEQALGKVDEVDARSDVYALGAQLYHLLVGRAPYVEPDSRVPGHLILRWVAEGPPKPLSEVAPNSHGELVAICEKAMSRDPKERYPSALALAEDLQAYLEGRVVSAYEGGAAAEFKKWVVRNKGMAAAIAAAIVIAIGGLAGVSVVQTKARELLAEQHGQVVEAKTALEQTNVDLERARDAADANASLAQRNEREAVLQSYAANLHAAANALEVGATEDAWASLQACPEELRGWEWQHLDLKTDASLMVLGPVEARLQRVDWSPDGGTVAASGGDVAGQGYDYDVRLWDAETGELQNELVRHTNDVHAIAFSPDGSRLVTVGADGFWRVWDTETGNDLGIGGVTLFRAYDVAFLPDGERIVLGTNGGLASVWDTRSGEKLQEIECGRGISRVAVHPDGTRVALGLSDLRVLVWDLALDEIVLGLGVPYIAARDDIGNNGIGDLEFDAPGKRLAVVSRVGASRIFDFDTGEVLTRLSGADARGDGVAFHPNGSWVVVSGKSAISFFDSRTGELLERLVGHDWFVSDVDFSADGARLASCSFDGTVRIWDGQPGSVVTAFSGEGSGFFASFSLIWSPDGNLLAWRPSSDVLSVMNTHTGEQLYTLRFTANLASAAFSPDGRSLLTVAFDSRGVSVWDARTGILVGEPGGPNRGYRADIHPDSTRLVVLHDESVGPETIVEVWDTATGELLRDFTGPPERAHSVAFSQDGERLYLGSTDGSVYVWDLESGELVNQILTVGNVHSLLLLVPSDGGDERELIARTNDHRDKFLRVYDIETGSVVRELRCSSPPLLVSLSPDGQRIAAGNLDGGISLLDPVRGEVVRLRGHERGVFRTAFSPDGLRLASQDWGGGHRIWDTVHPRERSWIREPALARRERKYEAHALIDALFDEWADLRLAADEIRRMDGIDSELRAIALDLCATRWDDENEGENELIEIVLDPHRSRTDYERVLRVASRVVELPDVDSDSWNGLIAVAQMRLGRHQELVDTFKTLENRNILGNTASALAHWELGFPDRTREILVAIRRNSNHLAGDENVRRWSQFLREVEEVVGGR